MTLQPVDSCPIRAKYQLERSAYLEVDGLRLHYTVEGQGPNLLLLHGVMASLHTWDGWVEQLKRHYRITRFDLPGFGLSDHLRDPAHYTPEHSCNLLEKVLDKLQIESFHLAGNSLGGFLGWYYAAHRPERLEKLILIDPIAYPQEVPFVIDLVAFPGIGPIARRFSPRILVERNIRQVYGDPRQITSQIVDRYYELMMRANNRFAMVETFRRISAWARDPHLSKAVSKVRCPTLLMWGERDRWVPKRLIARWQQDIPQLELKLYPGVGHMPMEEIPLETARDAHAFLSA